MHTGFNIFPTLFLCCWKYGMFFQFLAIFFCLMFVMGVRALLLPAQSHHHQHGEGSRLLGMWWARVPGDVTGKDSGRPPRSAACLHSCCRPEQSQCSVSLRASFGERHQQSVKDSLPTSKKVNIFFFPFFVLLFFFLINLWRRKIWLFK